MSGTRLTYIVSIPNLITSYRIQIQAFKIHFYHYEGKIYNVCVVYIIYLRNMIINSFF